MESFLKLLSCQSKNENSTKNLKHNFICWQSSSHEQISEVKEEPKQGVVEAVAIIRSLEERRKSSLDHHWAVPSKVRSLEEETTHASEAPCKLFDYMLKKMLFCVRIMKRGKYYRWKLYRVVLCIQTHSYKLIVLWIWL